MAMKGSNMVSQKCLRNLASVLALITVGSSASAYMCHPTNIHAPLDCMKSSFLMVRLLVEQGNPTSVYYLRAQVHASPSYPIGVTAFAFSDDAQQHELSGCAIYPLRTFTSDTETYSTGTCAAPASESVYGVEMCRSGSSWVYC
jgi:hypothetical protein